LRARVGLAVWDFDFVSLAYVLRRRLRVSRLNQIVVDDATRWLDRKDFQTLGPILAFSLSASFVMPRSE